MDGPIPHDEWPKMGTEVLQRCPGGNKGELGRQRGAGVESVTFKKQPMMDMVGLGASNGKVTGKHMTNEHEKSLSRTEAQHSRT